MKKKKYVTASDIGRVAFCPRSVSLEKQGHQVSTEAKARRQAGDLAHQQFNKAVKKNSDSRCFIATAVFGEMPPVTNDFRHYRETHLNTFAGSLFIKMYYKISPSICLIIRHFPALKKSAKVLLLFIHKRWIKR